MAGSSSRSWAQRILQLLGRMNSFHMQGSSKALCKPFVVAGTEVGVVQPRMFPLLGRYPKVFRVNDGAGGRVEVSSQLHSYQQRSTQLKQILGEWRLEKLFDSLSKWRNEVNGGAVLEGVVFSVILIKHSGGAVLPQVAGGLSAGLGVKETLIKECEEEACIPKSIARTAKPAGTISYTYEDEWGVFPECQFIYDLEIPADFVPEVGDGEVQEFYLWPLEKVKEAIAESEFKPNCAMVVLDFLIRRGILHADNERCYHQFVEGLHREL
ncbi:LOW QUALITY PROTEIN: thiamin pyrophosphokinase 2 [Scyliorhinus canicula]|uniref:LOW QUALITY PROTEIN: thiamin pyrophosphokinase 2 n=1 Tax=Scyliorhinus canicula TaxID=7830 RepID=UPI0018F74596|nr:LOW QUALITY PROTEIN: thiamin pyrophosphokinase 2 [Scyliorhinus canicula]